MKVLLTVILIIFIYINLFAQTTSLKGQLQNESKEPIPFANTALYSLPDSNLTKVETSDLQGAFQISNIKNGNYFLVISSVGLQKFTINEIIISNNKTLDFGTITLKNEIVELEELTVTASRDIVEIKSDRTVFNVEGTINSVGTDALTLLRRAPGVTVDNNDNINLIGRPGVLVYVDGKRLPLTGDDLSNYLQSLSADQIDRIDIITNPGVKYDAEGSAGIIDIRLKKNKNYGANSSFNSSFGQGRHGRYNLNGNVNFRNEKLSSFISLGTLRRKTFDDSELEGFQNGIKLYESNQFTTLWEEYNYRLGTDFFLSDNHTLGILLRGKIGNGNQELPNQIKIANQETPYEIDSALIVNGYSKNDRLQHAYNINYRFENPSGNTLNLDLDYGRYEKVVDRFQPNRYFNDNSELLTERINWFDTPTDIDIYTLKLDYEQNFKGGKLALGSKISRVVTDNTYLFYDESNDGVIRNDSRSNIFNYEENVYAAYVNFSKPIGNKWNINIGLRAEQTNAEGALTAFTPELVEAPVILDYLNWFPNAGINWKPNAKNNFNLNFGRRINRPDYNVLNPFNDQMSELSFEKGNPYLRPEIVNNLELGYSYAATYNFKIAYSKTTDQITRLIGPDDSDERANFITWENLAEQNVYSFNFSAPITIKNWWEAYFNLSASHISNKADYGEGNIVDLEVSTYKIYQQHTFSLTKGFKAEVSGFYSAPGVWGGVFRLDSRWSMNLGLQKKFLNEKLSVRVGVSDLFFKSGWSGNSNFGGLYYIGSGTFDSRRGSISLTYKFGNQKVKSRNRKTGLDSEGNRVSG